MEEAKLSVTNQEEEAKFDVNIFKYIFGFAEISAVKCAIELGIPDILEKKGKPMTLSELSTTLGCTSPSYLDRIMRFLVHQKVFNQNQTPQGTITYSQTTLSRCLLKHDDHENSMSALVLLEASPPMLATWQALSTRVIDHTISSFEAAHGGDDVWKYAAENPSHNKLLNDAMACHARISVNAIINGCPELFDGIESLVDVGGGDGTALSMFVKVFPWIHGINFDLPHVVSVAPFRRGVEHVAGNMFESVPKANAIFLMTVLHDWGDEECIQILKNCKEAIHHEGQKNGKVIIAEAVVGKEKEDKLEGVRLMLDMVMMAHTNTGKERTIKEWDYVIKMAGFSHFTVKSIPAVQSVIEEKFLVEPDSPTKIAYLVDHAN